jgi:polysaccharide export outer membrane protein
MKTSVVLFALCVIPLYPHGGALLLATQQTGTPGAASSTPPVDSAYLLGPGDTIRVTVWTGNELLEQSLTVAADGTILAPFFINKMIKVSGLTAIEVRDLLLAELSKTFISPVVQVITTGFESRRAFLVGEVTTPGNFPIAGSGRVLEFVVRHGGFSERANLSEVQITRKDGAKQRANLYDVIIKGDQSQNLTLLPGDIVYVPSVETIGKRYFMFGEVRNPGVLQSTEDLTLLEAIGRSGTLTIAAEAKHVIVVRLSASGESEVMDIAFSDLYRKGEFSRNIRLQNNDIVFVPRNFRTRVADALSAIAPVLALVRDAIFLSTVTTNK